MINQKVDIGEPFIDQSYEEDQKSKEAFNSIYDLVRNQSDHHDQFPPNEARIGNNFYQEENNLNKDTRFGGSALLFSRNEGENTKDILRYKENVYKSRELHRQLINKKNRWKPSELELAVLKLHFEKNKYPSKEEKEMILKNLEENFNSNIEMSQLNRWFQHEREKGVKQGFRNSSKNTYKKFGKEELDYLKEKFSHNTYPKTEEMIGMSNELGVNLSKIENWYKHNRRSLAKKGIFTLKTKKYFKKDEVNYLLKMFEVFPRPSKDKISEMAEHLGCSELQIKNWYSNKRKKQKLIAKKQSHETQETLLHQSTFQQFPQFNIQPAPEILNPFQNNIPIFPMNGFPQKNESNNMNIIQARPLNSFQIPQIASPFPSQVFAGAPITNGVLGTNEFSQMQLNTGALPTGSVPVFLIPASSLTTGQQLSLNQSGINSVILQNQEQHDSKIQPQQAFLLKNNNFIQQPSPNNSIMSFNNVVPQSFLSSIPNINVLPGFNALKQNDQSIGNGDMTGNPWINNIQQIQGSSPIIILSSNKPPTLQNQQIPLNFQNQPTNFTSNNVNPGAMTTGTFITSNFSQGGNSMPGLVPYEQQPLQIQYLTSLYCPYSNNNIFSSGNPVIYQNNPVTPLQNSGKIMNGMENMTGSNGSFQPIQQVQNTGFMNNGMLGIPDNVREQNNALNRHERENGGNNGTF